VGHETLRQFGQFILTVISIIIALEKQCDMLSYQLLTRVSPIDDSEAACVIYRKSATIPREYLVIQQAFRVTL
jgi:hypothetical protein